MALILHPDKNKTVGAEGAFKYVSEAWSILSDTSKRSSYDQRRNLSSAKTPRKKPAKRTANGSHNPSKSSNSNNALKRYTFWTTCCSCKVQFEYLRIYLNNRLTCQNCRTTFIAVETGRVPANCANPFVPTSAPCKNGHVQHEVNYGTYYLANNIHFVGGGVSSFPYGILSDFPSVTVQWVPLAGNVAQAHVSSVPASTGTATATVTSTVVPQQYDKVKRSRESSKSVGKDHYKNVSANVASGQMASMVDRPIKKMRCEETPKATKSEAADAKLVQGSRNGVSYELEKGIPTENSHSKLSNVNGQSSIAPAFDARKLLIGKSKTEVRKKLEEVRLRKKWEELGLETEQVLSATDKSSGDKNISGGSSGVPVLEKSSMSVSINVPDPDFHDFDKDRSETCFKPKQIWALYDDDNGMPRLYALIRKVISIKPFKIIVSYLNAKSNSEFAPVNWVASGFNKTCGTFRVGRCEMIDTVNVFSHIVDAEQIRRGFVRIFPKRGDIWAVYRNWSSDWDDTTPNEVRHQYEMVEVLNDYTEERGSCVSPLVKSAGFKTVFRKEKDRSSVRWIPKSEMFRYSHQVPSWSLERVETSSMLNGCWDLDPAATPPDLLNLITPPGECDEGLRGSGVRGS
ncbi:uncharacterized protein [Aristolochia californica]